MKLDRSRKFVRRGGVAIAFAGGLALAAAGVTACLGDDGGASGREDMETSLDKADWLEKTARLLRNGEGIGPRDDVDALLAMSKEAVVDQFMKDPRFGDMVLAFNLYYLGQSVDRVRLPNPSGGFTYDQKAFAWPQALASAKAVVEGGNYFDLFSARPPLVIQRRAQPVIPPRDAGAVLVPEGGAFDSDGGVVPPPLSDHDRVMAQFDGAISTVVTDKALGCSQFFSAFSGAANQLSRKGFPGFQLQSLWVGKSTPEFPNTVDCSTPEVLGDKLAASMRVVKGAIDTLMAAADAKVAPATIESIADLQAFSSAFEGLRPLVEPFTSQGFWQSYPSTSTNFHRKRAAYVLKTYFCDDLTPLSVPATADAGGPGDRHAQNPNCQACHYRLDPIGSLFRNRGAFGQDFTGQKTIRFDDGQTFKDERFDNYLAEWRNPDGSFRAGKYVIGADGKPTRDTTWLDSDGDTLSGLWSYLPRSENVKACLVRRLAEYVLGPKQVYDREWLRQIARQSKLKNSPLSGAAFKDVVKTLILSNTFSTQDPKPGVCYDAPANAPTNRPPCSVAHIVANQCADCHGSVQARGHIDLTTWAQLPDGTFSWPHEDEHGVPLSREESLKRIRERISTTDLDKRMPFQRALEGDDLNTLKNWLDESMKQGQPQ